MNTTKLERSLGDLSPTALALLDLMTAEADSDCRVTNLPRAICQVGALEEHLFELESRGLLTPKIEYLISPMYAFYRQRVLMLPGRDS